MILRAARARFASRRRGLGEARRPALRRAPGRASRRGRGASAMRSSSSRPTSGDLSRQASAEVVVRQERSAPGRDEVHRRDMLAEREAVGAGRLTRRLLQRADHRLEKGAALAHQDQHVAGRDRRGLRRRRRARARARRATASRRSTRRCAAPADRGILRRTGRRAASASSRSRLARRLRSASRTRQGRARRGGTRRAAAPSPRRPPCLRQVVATAKVLSTPSSTVGGRAERQVQRHFGEIERSVAGGGRRIRAAHLREHVRRRALEGKDRLLLVADREEGAHDRRARPRRR